MPEHNTLRLPSAHREHRSLRQEVEYLRAVEAIYRSVLQRERTVIYKVDLQTDVFEYISPNVEQLSGYTVEQWQEARFSGMLSQCHPDDIPEIQSALAELGRQRRPEQRCAILNYRWMDNFGQWRWCADHLQVVADQYGQPIALVGCVREITAPQDVLRLHHAWEESSTPALPLEETTTDDEKDSLSSLLSTSDLGLTQIQRRVLGLVLAGMTNNQIAQQLHRSVPAVEDHRHRIMQKLGADNPVDLVRKVLSACLRKPA